MRWIVAVFLCIVVSVCADDVEDKTDETSEDDVREVREYNHEVSKLSLLMNILLIE